jgi:hypothetical protein
LSHYLPPEIVYVASSASSIAPVVVQFVFQVEAAADHAQEAQIPLLGGEVLSQGGEVKDDDAVSLVAQAGSGAGRGPQPAIGPRAGGGRTCRDPLRGYPGGR